MQELIQKYNTPLFIYDCNIIKKRIKYLKSIFKKMDICYAIKANSFVIKEIINDIERVEVCSYGEYQICDKLKIDSNKLVLSGVNKNKLEFDNIFKSQKKIGRYTIESYEQFKLLNELSNTYQNNIDILIRITSGNQFGIDESELDKIFKEKNSYLNIIGIEYFSGTQKHSLKRIEKECLYLQELFLKIENNYHITLSELEYGPGLPIYYFKEEFDEAIFLKEVNDILNKYFSDKKIILEIGRSLVASCGYYCTKVIDLKENKKEKYAILDGGINHLVYYGQTMAMKIPDYEIINNKEKNKEIVNLCGSLCTTNDILVKQLEVPKLKIGDVFIFKNVGAYSITEGIALFLSRDMPKVVLISDKKILVRDTINSYKINCPNYEGQVKL